MVFFCSKQHASFGLTALAVLPVAGNFAVRMVRAVVKAVNNALDLILYMSMHRPNITLWVVATRNATLVGDDNNLVAAILSPSESLLCPLDPLKPTDLVEIVDIDIKGTVTVEKNSLIADTITPTEKMYIIDNQAKC